MLFTNLLNIFHFKAKQFDKVTLYVVRLDAYDNFTYCSPCVDCTKKINDTGIKKIVYVDKDGQLTSTTQL